MTLNDLQSINDETEIRHLPPNQIKHLGDLLAEDDEWKEFMRSIPGTQSGQGRFDTTDVE